MENEVVLGATLTLIILVLILIILFGVFQSKKNKYIQAQQRLKDEIAKSQIEIHEQALKNIGWELHDNIGQLLSVARMQLNILDTKLPDKLKDEADDINNLVGDSLKELRLLSKTLNPDIISEIGLVESIKLELERFNKLNFLNAKLHVEGEEKTVEHRDGIIIFRILQEFFSNVIKHSKALSLTVSLVYKPTQLIIEAVDDGVGFDYAEVIKGSGLINMRSRAALIGADYAIDSAPEKGVKLSLTYTFKEEKYEE